jgi:hypothetical protein
VKRATPMTVLVVAQLLVTLAAALFAVVVVPRLLAAYRDAAVPPPAAMALAGWPLAVAAGLALAVAAVGATSPGPRGPRLRTVAAALTVSGLGFVALALSSLAPLLR